jgi:hypothetical protein
MIRLLAACLLPVLLCQGSVLAGNRPEKPSRTIQRRNLECLVAFYCRKHHVSEDWVRAIIKVESDWNPRAISPKGAYGIMQLMPATARRFQVNSGISAENVEGGIKYLAWLKEHYKGGELLASATYYTGEHHIPTHSICSLSTAVRSYLARILVFYSDELMKKNGF